MANKTRAELELLATTNSMKAAPHLGGLCMYGAVMLYDALREIGLETKVAQGCGHYFAICEGFLVDVTASQFGQSKVVVRNYDKVKEGISSGKYARHWWQAVKIGNPSDLNLSSYRKTIATAKTLIK